MRWWYSENEERPYEKIYKNTTGKIKEREMEFDKSRVYTALNADELKAGDKVIVADQLAVLKQRVQEAKKDSAIVLRKINGEDWGRRFGFTMSDFALAYLVERKENCTNCEGCVACIKPDKTFRCEDYKPKKERDMRKVTLIDYDKTGKQYERDVVIPETVEECLAMDWNYTSEGKLPAKRDLNVSDRVVIAEVGCDNYCRFGYYDYELNEWFADGTAYPINVYAWRGIKPPKEET